MNFKDSQMSKRRLSFFFLTLSLVYDWAKNYCSSSSSFFFFWPFPVTHTRYTFCCPNRWLAQCSASRRDSGYTLLGKVRVVDPYYSRDRIPGHFHLLRPLYTVLLARREGEEVSDWWRPNMVPLQLILDRQLRHLEYASTFDFWRSTKTIAEMVFSENLTVLTWRAGLKT